jgi:hypothetical protein
LSQAKVFNLDNLEMTWEEFRKRHARHAADGKWLDEFKDLLKEVSNNADEFQLAGRQVAVLRPGNLNQKRLATEQPDVIARYTRSVYETKFDTEAFRQEMPELYEQYRARGLVLADKPSLEGF